MRGKTNPEVVERVDAIVAKYDDPSGMVIGALQDIQDEFNYLRQDAMRYFSEKSGVLTHPALRSGPFLRRLQPQAAGQVHHIRVCLGTACHLKGGGNIAHAVSQELGIADGETTSDLMFSLERVHCLGACALAPLVTVNGKYYGKMTIAKMMKLLEECRQQDAQIAV